MELTRVECSSNWPPVPMFGWRWGKERDSPKTAIGRGNYGDKIRYHAAFGAVRRKVKFTGTIPGLGPDSCGTVDVVVWNVYGV